MKPARLTVFLLPLLAGCATLSEPECRNADWRIIGMEDGAAGRDIAYLGRHRTACADHGVTPDLEAYRQGHAEGLRRFCTPARGYDLGRRGKDYGGVCPPALERDFLDAYDYGLRLHTAEDRVQELDAAIRSNGRRMADLEDEVAELEERLVEAGTTARRRAELVDEIRARHEALARLEAETAVRVRERAAAAAALRDLEAPAY